MKVVDRSPKHKWFVPCLNNNCHVIKNGREVPSRMQLEMRELNYWKTGHEMLDFPHYRCEQTGCEYHQNPKRAIEISRWCSLKRTPFRSNEGLAADEMETMI